MAYTVSLSNRFKKDFRRCIKRGLNMKHITDAMDLLEATGTLPACQVSSAQAVRRQGWPVGVPHRARLVDDMGAKRHAADASLPADRHPLRPILGALPSAPSLSSGIIEEFEKNLVSHGSNFAMYGTRSSSNMSYVKLYGYMTVAYHNSDSVFVNKLWRKYKEEIEGLKNVLVLDGKVRIYFPLREAQVEYYNKIISCNDLGVFETNEAIDPMALKICGRDKTSKTVLTTFKKSIKPEKYYSESGALIFNLGERKFCCKNKLIKKRMKTLDEINGDGKISCTKNHSPSRNCTEAFGCYQNRCTPLYDGCMDYNGFGTDCSGSHLYFIGSDCSVAMKNGHCWNELM